MSLSCDRIDCMRRRAVSVVEGTLAQHLLLQMQGQQSAGKLQTRPLLRCNCGFHYSGGFVSWAACRAGIAACAASSKNSLACADGSVCCSAVISLACGVIFAGATLAAAANCWGITNLHTRVSAYLQRCQLAHPPPCTCICSAARPGTRREVHFAAAWLTGVQTKTVTQSKPIPRARHALKRKKSSVRDGNILLDALDCLSSLLICVQCLATPVQANCRAVAAGW